jgi:hypothetical protein
LEVLRKESTRVRGAAKVAASPADDPRLDPCQTPHPVTSAPVLPSSFARGQASMLVALASLAHALSIRTLALVDTHMHWG